MNVPIGALALVLAFKLLPRSQPQRGQRLDVIGLALLSPGLAGIVFGLSETSSHGAALFGSLVLLPLYLQVDRGESTLATAGSGSAAA